MSLGKQGRGSAAIFSLTGCEQALKSHGEASRTPREVRVQRVGAKFRARKPQKEIKCPKLLWPAENWAWHRSTEKYQWWRVRRDQRWALAVGTWEAMNPSVLPGTPLQSWKQHGKTQGEVWEAFVTRSCSAEKREVQPFGILDLKGNAGGWGAAEHCICIHFSNIHDTQILGSLHVKLPFI